MVLADSDRVASRWGAEENQAITLVVVQLGFGESVSGAVIVRVHPATGQGVVGRIATLVLLGGRVGQLVEVVPLVADVGVAPVGRADVGDHRPEEVLEVGVEPAVEDGVGDGAGHGHGVDHEKGNVLNLQKRSFSSMSFFMYPRSNVQIWRTFLYSRIVLIKQDKPINSFGPELPSRPLDDTVKFIFNREI